MNIQRILLACIVVFEVLIGSAYADETLTGDVTGDGLPDTLHQQWLGDFKTKLTLKDSSGQVLWTSEEGPVSMGLFDINGDGRDDICLGIGRGGPAYRFSFLTWSGGRLIPLAPDYSAYHWYPGKKLLVNPTNSHKGSGSLMYLSKDGTRVRGKIVVNAGVGVQRPVHVRLTKDGMSFACLGDWEGDKDDKLLLPKALADKLTETDLKGRDARTLTLIRNEIFAVHSRPFADPQLKAYFSKKSYYQPRTDQYRYKDSDLSEVQRQNVKFIHDYQKARNLMW